MKNACPGFLLSHWYDLHAHFRQEELLAPPHNYPIGCRQQ